MQSIPIKCVSLLFIVGHVSSAFAMADFVPPLYEIVLQQGYVQCSEYVSSCRAGVYILSSDPLVELDMMYDFWTFLINVIFHISVLTWKRADAPLLT